MPYPSAQRESARPAQTVATSTRDRIWTIPNLISFARLLGVPLFLYLYLVVRADVAAIVLLALAGATDWVDGYLARRLRQVSRLGEVLDPTADRLYILATLVAFTIHEVVPWPFTAALVAREVMLGVCLVVLRRHGYGPLPVHYVGKTATFILLFAFPVLLLAAQGNAASAAASAIGWGLAWWGLGLYWVAGVLYVAQTAQLLRRRDQAGAA